MARLLGATILAAVWLASYAVQGTTILWKAPNAAVYLGLPSSELEFENPLAGTETVLGHAVLDWRDADYNKPGHPVYDDWSVFLNGGTIDGTLNEIWMRKAGQYIWTTTLAPSEIVSIHMTGDQNDGLADIYVDGNQVASLNMNNPAVGGTVLILVRGLANTTHRLEVDDVSWTGTTTDVHTFGAAALKENPIKWDQPPVTGVATNVFDGWNEISTSVPPYNRAAADDWVCTTTNPVTTIRWWGSFANWRSNTPPPFLPNAFQITMWTDMPASGGNFSHPDKAIWQVYCTNFSGPKFVGWDIDPHTFIPDGGPLTNRVEACFLFEQKLRPFEYFTQPGPTGTVYWVSICAVYSQGTAGPNPWGWKTRPRDLTSLAPDDAVVITQPPAAAILPGAAYVAGYSLFWPDPTNSWDLAFELISEQVITTTGSKWEQPPDLSTNGMDVNATLFSTVPPPMPPFLLADDFRCTNREPITNITIWGSWFQDFEIQQLVCNVTFTLSIHQDIPASQSPAGYSMPGAPLRTWTFYPGQYICKPYAANLLEGWMDPPGGYMWPGDFSCYQYDFNIPLTQQPFVQEGSPANPITYWLDVQAQVPWLPSMARFGWKTSIKHWNDAAVWINASEPYNGLWQQLLYPPPHPWFNTNVDMAFRLNQRTGQQEVSEIKWSQPPVPSTEGFNGWNELSWYGESQIVADDWVCTSTNPVTDIHWWGSFLNWSATEAPQLPDAFRITFWTDAPNNAAEPFSHPAQCVWMVTCTNYTYEHVGWDIDPRDPDALPEACFRFHQELATNEWFHQEFSPAGIGPTNIWWISIGAVYFNQFPQFPWGWKTRPRDTNSLAPDDAVRIFLPTAPVPGQPYAVGTNIWWPTASKSWDMAFTLTTSTNQCPPPTIICSNLNVQCGATSSVQSPPFAWDNCCNVALVPTLVFSQTNGSCPWLITETWKATDCRGQANTCTRLVTVMDTNPPVISCATNKTVECGTAWSFDPPTASDTCCGTNITITIVNTVTNGSCPWLITRTWKATDCCTNSATCSQTVTVVDTTPPAITCATNKTVVAGWPWSFDPPTASDRCCGTNLTVSILSTVTNRPCPLTITRTWVAVDCCNLSNTCSQTVTVVNTNTPPADTNIVKYVQWPQLFGGYDVYDRTVIFLADDFPCTNTGPITDIHIWCSYAGDGVTNHPIWLGIWSDVPAAGTSFSHPGQLLWQQIFAPDQYQHYFWGCGDELYFSPGGSPFIYGPDSQVYYYVFSPTNPFIQQGSPQHPTNYWLSVYCTDFTWFGWKSTTDVHHDAAVYGSSASLPGTTNWGVVKDPFQGAPLDLAFMITTSTNQLPSSGIKFTQPPDLSTNGFDVRAVRPKILADDFLCTKTGPITNIHVWASWLRDSVDTNAVFQLGFWSDVPITTGLGANLLTNGTFEAAFTNAGFSGPNDGMADSVPPGWYRQETFSGGVTENSYIGPVADNGLSAPGSQAVMFARTLGGSSGDWTAIYQPLSINAGLYSHLYLTMDVRVWSHNLPAGGWVVPAFEWPAVVEVDYVDTTGHNQILAPWLVSRSAGR